MPTYRTYDYGFSGSQRTLIYTVDEMAEALGLELIDVLAGLSRGEFCYHGYDDFGHGKEPVFNNGCYIDNLLRSLKKESTQNGKTSTESQTAIGTKGPAGQLQAGSPVSIEARADNMATHE